MASVSSLSSSSSSSSVYGNRTYNIISGLASGMDTEELISGMVQSYQQKIQSLQQKNTKLQWQQEAIQSISDKLVEFDRNYSSYVYSDTNLLSSSFFNNAVNTTTNGTYANLVTASGKTSSTVILNAVRQLATAARYSISADDLNGNVSTDKAGNTTITGGSMKVNSDDTVTVSNLAGSMTFSYGNKTVSIDLGQRELFTDDSGNFSADALEKAITEKLSEQQISTSGGSGSADQYIGVDVKDDGNGNISISVSDKKNAGNTVSISGATGDLGELVGDLGDGKSEVSLGASKDLTSNISLGDFVAGQTLTVSMDGKSKTISLDKFKDISSVSDFEATLNEELKNAFGTVTGADGKVVNKVSATFDKDGISFTMDPSVKNSTFSVTASTSDVGDVLGIGSGLTSYLDTNKTLGELNLGSGFNWENGTIVKGSGDKAIEQKDDDGNIIGYVDADGNAVNANNERLGKDGKVLYSYDLIINDVKIGSYTRDTEMNTIINAINNNTEAGVNVTYSQTSGQFVFTAKDTGSAGRVEIKTGGLGAVLFGATVQEAEDPDNQNPATTTKTGTYEAGKDALINVTINGQNMELVRSSNTVDLDGMKVTVSGTFNEKATLSQDGKTMVNKETGADGTERETAVDTVSFTSKTDADTIVDAVKKMVEDLNTIIKEVKSAYSDMPLEQSDGSSYEPLTDEDMEDMSESAIENYEEKAKTGILFMDSDLSSLYNDLRSAISVSGSDGATLRSIGISTSYSDGLTTLTFDEKTFREALESDPDKVQEAFTKSKENGAATDGLMTTLKSITDRYASTTGDTKGILIEKAGSKYSPTAALDNTILNQMNDVEEEISKWQDKMSNQVDYYTNKFTQLELLMNQMNSQSSALSGLLGG